MKKTAIFPGSFDPITLGHTDIIERGLTVFDEVVVAIGENSSKSHRYSLDQRMDMIRACFPNEERVVVESYSGLTIEYAKKRGVNHLLRGIRTMGDFEYERTIGMMNFAMAPEVDTVFLISSPEYSALSSTVVRDILRNAGDVTRFTPSAIHSLL